MGRTDAAQDARDAEAKAFSRLRVAHRTTIGFSDAAVDFAEAVKSGERARLAGLVRRMRKEMPDVTHDDRTRYAAAGCNAALSTVLALLESPE